MVVLYQVPAECLPTIQGIVVLYVDTPRLIAAEAAVGGVFGFQAVVVVAEVVVGGVFGFQAVVAEVEVVVADGVLSSWLVSNFLGVSRIEKKAVSLHCN